MTIEVKHTTQATGTDAGNGEIAKAQWNEAHTLNMATNRLLGRTTASAGPVEEISVGTGLSLSGGVLAAAGGGSSTLTIQNKTAAYTVVASDNGKIINCSGGSFTISLTAAATLGAGFNCWVWNAGAAASYAVTIDPNGSETIDGVDTLILRQGEGTQVVCDGTNWRTGAKKTMRMYAENFGSTNARPVASGGDSFAIGDTATSSGSDSTAIGSRTTSGAQRSTALGMNSSLQGSVTATGSGAMALGGSYASGSNSFAAAVANNTSSYGATGSNSVAIGRYSKAEASGAVAIGKNATSSGINSLAFCGSGGLGSGATASQQSSVAIGDGARALVIGKFVYSGDGLLAAAQQFGLVVLGQATTGATATVLTSNASTAAANNQIILPDNSAYAFTGTVVARQQAAGGTASAAWKVEGLIRREGTAGTTTLVASTVTAISNVPGWTLALSADTTNGGLAVTATGAAATNIRWVATIQTSEVTYS